MPRFVETNQKIYNIIIEINERFEDLDGIPISELFRELRKEEILKGSKTIKKHLQFLESENKIKISNWNIKVHNK